MNSDVPSGLTPIDKSQASAEIKAAQVQVRIRGVDFEDGSELTYEVDRVQFSQRSESPQSEMTQQLTTDKNLHEYINMLKQAAELDDNAPLGDSITHYDPYTGGIHGNKRPDYMA